MRVPIGSSLAFSRTAALPSNLTSEPSARRIPFAVRTTTAETRPERCHCTSHFEATPGGALRPEIDAYAWADNDTLRRLLGQSMRRLLLDKNLLEVARGALGLKVIP